MSVSSSRLAVLATAALAVSVAATTLEAQSRRAVPRAQAGAAVNGQRAAQAQFDNGYRDGLREGETDARRGERFNFTDERAWQRTRDNRPFRDGFERGYGEGYRRGGYVGRGGYGGRHDGGYRGNGCYGGYGAYSNPATAAGFDDGYEEGLDDARDNDRYDPIRSKDYRDGDNGYDRRFGTKDQWKIAYREGFKLGYEQGYREGRYYRED